MVWKRYEGASLMQAHIEDIFGSGDRLAARLTFRGTHDGEFQGIPATRRAVEYTSIEVYRISGGLIAEEWICSYAHLDAADRQPRSRQAMS
jgi:predicted ester cyclase